MTAADTNYLASKLPWPKGAIEDWRQGASYGEIKDKYGRSYSGVVKLVRQQKLLGEKRVVALDKRRKGGTKKYLDQMPISPQHIAVGIRLNRYRELERQINFDQMGKLISTNRMVARKMELGIHDFTMSQIQTISELLAMPVGDLMKPASVRK